MSSGLRRRAPHLSVVESGSEARTSTTGFHDGVEAQCSREIDHAVLMARAQAGDSVAYRRLLDEVTPYLRAFVARRIGDPNDVEDVLQDILLTVHAIRYTFEPTRPFGPWLVAIADRRLIDRLRQRSRRRSRETPLAPEHETFPGDQTNLEDETDRQNLETAVGKLSTSERNAIRLLKLKEMSLKEAAAASGMSIAALKVATHRGLKNLRKMLLSPRGDA
jgi:RNA polymerase sigma-70 factor, ECF subfamily